MASTDPSGPAVAGRSTPSMADREIRAGTGRVIRIGMAQLLVQPGQRNANLTRAADLVRQAAHGA